MMLRNASTFMAAPCNSGCDTSLRSVLLPFTSNRSPLVIHSLRQRSYSHMPQMFFRKRVVPSTPPSLVKFSSYERSVMIGCFVSIPIRLHVPLDR